MIALRQVGEPFDAASDMGSLALDLATGYVAGGTFYFLTIWRPKAVERERVLPIVARDAIQLAGAASSFVHHLRYAAGATLMEGPLDRQHFESVVRDLSPSANANKINLDGKPASLADALDYEWRRQEHLETKIERWAGLVSVDLLVLVHGVVDADIVGPMLGPLLRVQTGSFGGNSGLLADWIESSDALRLYVAEELRGHLKRTRYDPDAVADGRIFAPSTRHQCMTLGRLTIVEKHAKG